MKANELRIGNYFLDRGNKTLRIDWFERSKACMTMMIGNMEVHPLTEDFEYMQPIPLTEEWLLKFGFEWSIRHQATHKEGFEFDLNSLVYGGYSLSTWKRGVIIVESIKYVHQLQNLYFALTGEELTI